MDTLNLRECNQCQRALPLHNEVQFGYYCCDEYYCSNNCIEQSCADAGTTWAKHYTDDGECYFTEWEINEQ